MNALAVPAAEAAGSSLRGLAATASPGLPLLAAWQQVAAKRVAQLQFPHARLDAWRATDPGVIERAEFVSAQPAATVPAVDLSGHRDPAAAAELLFVDGRHMPAASRAMRGESIVVSARQGMPAHLPFVSTVNQVGRHCDGTDRFFVSLNDAAFDDLAVLRISGQIDAPIRIVHIALQPKVAHFPRVVVVLERNARAVLIEEFHATAAASLQCAVTELVLEEHARLDYSRVVHGSDDASHLGYCAASIAAQAELSARSLALRGRFARIEWEARLQHEASCTWDGLNLAARRQTVAQHTEFRHQGPDGRLRQGQRNVVGGAGLAVFNGRIVVDSAAQKIDAAQQTRSLLLSDRARVDVRPQLEIHADDVRCSHGATVGQLQSEELFYLTSRGIGESTARALLVEGFATELLDRVPLPALTENLRLAIATFTREVT